MITVKWQLALILILPFILFGCSDQQRSPLGFKTVGECNAQTTRASATIQCYHNAAITAAYLDRKSEAISICRSIWTEFRGHPDDGNDIRRKAELAYNTCFYDIAKITVDPYLCSSIQQHDNLGTGLLGAQVTQDQCIVDVTGLADSDPEHYFETHSSICSVAFLLPLLMLFILHQERP